MEVTKYRKLILSFIASLTSCNHMGDVCDDINFVLKKLGIKIEWDDMEELADELAKMNINTLYGTSLEKD